MGEDWNEWYGTENQIWSGNPNATLMAEAGALTPGSALDVGCGEGADADAVWLATQGWQVVGLDVSSVALERGRLAAAAAGVDVEWLHSGLVEADLARSFDLVSAHYAALLKSDDHDAERALMAAVRPGGVLLFVHHAEFGHEGASDHGHDLDQYVGPDDLAQYLAGEWTLEVRDERTREVTEGAGRGHSRDVVLRYRRPLPVR